MDCPFYYYVESPFLLINAFPLNSILSDRMLLNQCCFYYHWHGIVFSFVNVVYYIDCFVDIEESLHPWDKAHLVMVYDLFNVLLDSDC